MSESASRPGKDGVSIDSASESSSIVYDHEPFETYRVKVLAFSCHLWSDSSCNNFDIQKMSGGGFNRIIGISYNPPDRLQKQEYILRIPRFDATRLDRDVAAIRAVQELGQIPVPEIFAFDETSDNLLGNPYMVQIRLPGADLLSSFPDLNFQRKTYVATKLGSIVKRMLWFNDPAAGSFSLSDDTAESRSCGQHVIITPFYDSKGMTTSPSAPQSSTLGMLSTIFKARKEDGERDFPLDNLRPKFYDKFVAMAQELDKGLWFQGIHNSICHLDFAPRNILIRPDADCPDTIMSGVLDWDSAVSAPSFMSCAPPLWLWAWSDDEDEDERMANEQPSTEEGRALKAIFEKAAGPEYLRCAYSPTYRLARRLVRFAIDGIRSSEDVEEAEVMLQEWKEVHNPLAAGEI